MSQSVQRLEVSQSPTVEFQSCSNFGPVKLAGTAGDMSVHYNYQRDPEGHVVPEDLLFMVQVKNSPFLGADISGAFVKSAAPGALSEAKPASMAVSENYMPHSTGMMPVRLDNKGSLAYLNLDVFQNEAKEVLPETRHFVVEVRPDKKDPRQCSLSGFMVERSALQASVIDLKEYSQASRSHRFRRR